MSKELLLIVDSVAHEKDIPRQAIFEALEAALAGVSRKQLGGEALVRVAVNTHDGAISAFRQWQVVADDERMENPLEQVRLMDARDDNYDVEVGDILEEAIDPPQLTRVAAQTANQILVQRVREGERERVRGEWADRVGEMVTGAVKRIDRGALIIDINGAEAGLARSAQIPGERLKIGARVRVMVTAINLEARGAPLVVSRTDPRLLSELFAVEVPEVREGLVEIKAVARDPGARSKIAVVSHDRRTDPIGACIGMRGARVQAIANELGGERVDIVLWSDEPAQMVINAIAPGQIEKIVLIEDERRMELAVADGGLGIALGRGGQNVRLASALCGWQLRVMSVEEFDAKAEDEITQIKQLFVAGLDVDDDIAQLLAEAGFASLEEVAFAPIGELLVIEGFDEGVVEELRDRARDALLTAALVVEEAADHPLRDLDGMTDTIASALGERQIDSIQTLAEACVDELEGIDGLSGELAGKLIMGARKVWFGA